MMGTKSGVREKGLEEVTHAERMAEFTVGPGLRWTLKVDSGQKWDF